MISGHKQGFSIKYYRKVIYFKDLVVKNHKSDDYRDVRLEVSTKWTEKIDGNENLGRDRQNY